MKYCPFCGAELLPGALSFCPECGEALPTPQTNAQEPAAPTQEKRRKRSQKSQTAPEVDSNYDGYYDDVEPLDADREREGMDTRLIGKVALVCLGVALVIGGCVAVLFLYECCKKRTPAV